jgi:phosphopantothenoylcysteine decarboxylase/phosphopantothenate--cysteine ligase
MAYAMPVEMSNSKTTTIIVGVTGGIAAYKSVDLVSRLKKSGHDVHVLMTKAATEFVTPLTFGAISGNPVITNLFGEASGEKAYPHLYPATRADVFMVAPATADIIARLVRGEGDDVVTTSALSLPSTCLRFFAPAMNVEMWHQPVVQENSRALEAKGWICLGPESGELACGMTGEGRMAEPAELADQIAVALAHRDIWSGKNVMILSGPTCEYLDPVRFISNASSGRMGKALADAALAMGAEVKFISGPVAAEQLPSGPRLTIENVVSAEDMLTAARKYYAASDVVIFAAAVADYRPANRSTEKLPKQSGGFDLKLEATPDIAAQLNAMKKPGQVAIGFALQTSDGEARAREKLAAKKFDAIVLNTPEALGATAARYDFIQPSNATEKWGMLTKSGCARRVLAFAAAHR